MIINHIDNHNHDAGLHGGGAGGGVRVGRPAGCFHNILVMLLLLLLLLIIIIIMIMMMIMIMIIQTKMIMIIIVILVMIMIIIIMIIITITTIVITRCLRARGGRRPLAGGRRAHGWDPRRAARGIIAYYGILVEFSLL